MCLDVDLCTESCNSLECSGTHESICSKDSEHVVYLTDSVESLELTCSFDTRSQTVNSRWLVENVNQLLWVTSSDEVLLYDKWLINSVATSLGMTNNMADISVSLPISLFSTGEENFQFSLHDEFGEFLDSYSVNISE